MRAAGKCRVSLVSAAAIAALLSVSEARAIPAFARKYQTSCQTCHIVFPRLTPFGEAFRLNGYRFPEGSDAKMSKEAPVSLGSEAYKKLWPRSVWPGEIPSHVPLSVLVESEVEYAPGSDPRAQLDGLAGEFAVLAGGTLGDSISFYGEVAFEVEEDESEVELERINAIFTPFGSPVLHAKIGRFEPGVSLVSSHRRLTTAPYLLTTALIGDNAFGLEPLQSGIEFSGVFGRRWLWNAGYVEGRANEPNNSKDVYGRLAVKIGGLPFDGSTRAGAAPVSEKPWSELSLTLSGFTYSGNALLPETTFSDPNMILPDVTVLEQEDEFDITGFEAQVNIKDLIVNVGAASLSNDAPFQNPFGPTGTDVDSDLRSVELTWVALPWLVPVVRWESLEIEDEEEQRLAIATNFLIRSNVRAFAAWVGEKGEENSGFPTDEYALGLEFGF